MREALISDELLSWYDRHARGLPWRVPPEQSRLGQRADPYHVWLSEVMLQQTTVVAVRAYFEAFTRRWPTVADLAAADDADVMAAWAGLGYYARARNLLKCARIVANELGGVFPSDRDALLKLPGIGPYTASAVAAIAFDRPETVVDGNVERVMARLFSVLTPLPDAKPELTQHAARLTPQTRPGDYAQAVMDLGATVCTPRSPACGICPVVSDCLARAEGIAAELPRKRRKTPKPTRRGLVYVVQREDDALLLETRPPSGLLGGMLGWPTSDWGDNPEPAPPVDTNWRKTGLEVRHTFTHFHLLLDILTARVSLSAQPDRGAFVPLADFDARDLPTLMKKVHDLSLPLPMPADPVHDS